MLKAEFTGQFKKDYKLALKSGCDPNHRRRPAPPSLTLCRRPPASEENRGRILSLLQGMANLRGNCNDFVT